MKPITARKWCDDFEIVYESQEPYVNFLPQILNITELVIIDLKVSETWHYKGAKEIDIQIQYELAGKGYTIWTQRLGDYINCDIFLLLNHQLGLTEYKFAVSHTEETVYFISATEKRQLKEKGSKFSQIDFVTSFYFLVYNIAKHLQHQESDYTYTMLSLMNDFAEEYHILNYQQKNFPSVKKYIFENIYSKLNWEQIAAKQISIENIHFLI
ncbi:MAG: hypothetical protein AAF518_19295 [Spirochaetota bacterium]